MLLSLLEVLEEEAVVQVLLMVLVLTATAALVGSTRSGRPASVATARQAPKKACLALG